MSDVEITLNGEHVTLRCTIRAVREITAAFGNYMEAFKRLAEFDHGAYVAIVAAGIGKKRSEVDEDVFKTGLPVLTGPLSDYVGLLSRGGRPEPVEGAPVGEA